MKIVKLDNRLVPAYDKFVEKIEHAGFFYSNKYRLILRETLDSEDNYLVLLNDANEISGVFPSFLKKNTQFGNVLNSLPFYGSNGGILSVTGDHLEKTFLLEAFYQFAKEKNCISSTIITSPFEEDNGLYSNTTGINYKDERIGQITSLPVNSDNIEKDLMDLFHQKTRNMVRKSQKNNFIINDLYSSEVFDFLYITHKENIQNLGGIAKQKSFFESVRKNMDYGVDYRIFSCSLNNELIAALFLFYYNKTVEYFTPVIKKEFRNLQPMTLLIYEAMIDACSKSYKYWNWGGTWLSQDGVYLFKSRWGTIDKNYYYYTRIFDDNVLLFSKETLLNQYPYFYVLPFNYLKEQTEA